jgi:hypothetical protein
MDAPQLKGAKVKVEFSPLVFFVLQMLVSRRARYPRRGRWIENQAGHSGERLPGQFEDHEDSGGTLSDLRRDGLWEYECAAVGTSGSLTRCMNLVLGNLRRPCPQLAGVAFFRLDACGLMCRARLTTELVRPEGFSPAPTMAARHLLRRVSRWRRGHACHGRVFRALTAGARGN